MTGGSSRRVGLLAPMRSELKPLRRKLRLERRDEGEDEWHVGRTERVDLVASLANIGPTAATAATHRMLDAFEVHHVVVVGIAGAVDPALEIGELVVPEVVVDWKTGHEYAPHHLPDQRPRGGLVTTDELLYRPDVLQSLLDRGVIAVDMETAAVAAACEERDVPWTVFRAISDRAAEADVMAEGIMAMVKPDGSTDPGRAARYLATHLHRIPYLARLARGSQLAARRAAAAATRALRD